jgi:ubiquinone/menaquinone biosynthesis C-methylase UbiE
MADSISSRLKIWENWAPPVDHPLFAPTSERGGIGVSHPPEQANVYFTAETLGRSAPREGGDPYSLQWFLEIETLRYGRHGSWLPRLLEFSKHGGDRLLGIGGGLGTDWVQYARHGAEVVVCSSTTEQRQLVQRHFDLRGVRGQFLPAISSKLPIDSASIDVVCLSSLLQSNLETEPLIAEVYRVLKPGGKVLALAKAYYDVNYWCYRWLPFLNRSWTTNQATAPRAYKGTQLRRLFSKFCEHRFYKRHLRRSDIPHVYRWLPLPMLERIMGRFLVMKSFKPLSSAMHTSHAA